MKKIEEMTQEELEEIIKEGDKRRERYYQEEASEAEKKELEEMQRYSERRLKYIREGNFYDALSKDYLHNQSYKERLAKAEELNGCKFKEAKPCKDRFAPRDDFSGVSYPSQCDGRVVSVPRSPGLWSIRLHGLVLGPIIGICLLGVSMTDDSMPAWHSWLGLFLLTAFPLIMYKIGNAIRIVDAIEFNRHTGLVRTPYTLFRKPFYIPIEDLEFVVGPEVKNMRGSASMQTGYLSCRKYPEHYWFGNRIGIAGGGDAHDWSQMNRFMDITQPIDEYYHSAMEYTFKKNRNAHGNGPFPEVMKKYFDADDCQVNRMEVW
ncbi:hypothetical protein [Pseudoalteromonas maricaloris]|uniref:hypothetical protein n=1 Tax=Pseudoalteromonas maricaloris TaxID=184924 RepID=UPI00057F9647|nr:hypothetical protein [Pseudoalteromonas flavipulchra]KID34777.1 hypothetical protein QT15_16915 [Pseudoalteromonas flavipulchra NCIMB 2033 = ATCC BAA-314]MBD0781300.1 hypothetical protein [Pseudoalteromonas flavipulchra]MBE0372814.1 hypothetical protein [Pseudoalteromonas flavipulchra NCIMB 2033 = ATCC BAA-314]